MTMLEYSKWGNFKNVIKKAIALAQTYFAVQTRKQELTRKEYEQLSEDEKRLYTRKNVKEKNKKLKASNQNKLT